VRAASCAQEKRIIPCRANQETASLAVED